jgi:hypothetical protein
MNCTKSPAQCWFKNADSKCVFGHSFLKRTLMNQFWSLTVKKILMMSKNTIFQGKSFSVPIVLFGKCLISFTQQQMFLPGKIVFKQILDHQYNPCILILHVYWSLHRIYFSHVNAQFFLSVLEVLGHVTIPLFFSVNTGLNFVGVLTATLCTSL